MRRFAIVVLTVFLAFSFCGCAAEYTSEIEDDAIVTEEQNASNEESKDVLINADKYIIHTPYYQIYEESLQKYRYRIAYGDYVFVDEIKEGTAPDIVDKGNGILRLHLGYGTNAFTVKYFDVYNKAVSSELYPYTVYADYIDTYAGDYYFAYFKMEEEPKLHIEGFFDCSGFSTELDLDFSMPTCEKIIFLNEAEIYLEYIDSNSEIIRKVVNYKN